MSDLVIDPNATAIATLHEILVRDQAAQIETKKIYRGQVQRSWFSKCDKIDEMQRAWTDVILTLGKESVFPQVLYQVTKCPSTLLLLKLREEDLDHPLEVRPRLTMNEWAYILVFFGGQNGHDMLPVLWRIWSGYDDEREHVQKSEAECHVMLISILKKIRDVNRSINPVEIMHTLLDQPALADTATRATEDAIGYTLAIPQRTASYAIDEDLLAACAVLQRSQINNPALSWKLINSITTPEPRHIPLSKFDALYPYRVAIDLKCPVVRYASEVKRTIPCIIIAFRGRVDDLDREQRKAAFQINEIVLYSPNRRIRIRRTDPHPTFWSGDKYAYQLEASTDRPPFLIDRKRGPPRQMFLPELFLEVLGRAHRPAPPSSRRIRRADL